MHLKRLLWTFGLLGLLTTFAWAAESGGAVHGEAISTPAMAAHAEDPAAAHGDDEAHAEHHGLPLYAVPIYDFGGLVITNSMLVTWIVALALILFARTATRQMRDVPVGAQNFWEWLVESLYEFLGSILGSDLVKRTFWFFATVFIFILATNYFGLIPGVGSIGWKVAMADGSKQFLPFFRGANADLNMTFAMAMIFFVMWTIWALQINGPGGFIHHIFGAKGDTTGALKALMVVIFLFVGLIETISILFRPVSLSFRLFGNIYGGENMLEAMALMSSNVFLASLMSIPFYFYELLVGLVQALVFTLLTAVFTFLICSHDEEHGEAKHT